MAHLCVKEKVEMEVKVVLEVVLEVEINLSTIPQLMLRWLKLSEAAPKMATSAGETGAQGKDKTNVRMNGEHSGMCWKYHPVPHTLLQPQSLSCWV